VNVDRHAITLDIDALLGRPGSVDAAALAHGPTESAAEAGSQLRLQYQPVINLPSGELIALKALPLWEHPVLGTLSPRRFIPPVLAAGRAAELFDVVLQQACRDSAHWIGAGQQGIRIDIDLLPGQFYDDTLAARAGAILAAWPPMPAQICLQISEAILRQDRAAGQLVLQRLKETGVALALSNFGAGAFAIDAIQSMPFARINIGPAFVQDMVALADDAAMAQHIIGAAHDCGMRAGADGIETAIEFELLRNSGCDEVQGPYFFRALAVHEIDKLLPQRASFSELALLPQKPRRSLLLIDDEPNILSALKRLLRPDNYDIQIANSGAAALALLDQCRFDVIVCDQRMPGMSGVEFFGIAKQRCPDSVRMILSGYTELQSVIDAVNEGAIYKFLCKPWEDLQLRGHIAEAFERKEMADDNQRLNQAVHAANQRLMLANRQMEALLAQQQQQILSDEVSLDIVREVLHHVPLPVIGTDDDGLIVFANLAAQALLQGRTLLGGDISQIFSQIAGQGLASAVPAEAARDGDARFVQCGQTTFQIKTHQMGSGSQSRGKLLVFTEMAGIP